MKTIATQLYSYNELSDSAKARVIRDKAENVETDYLGEEMLASLKAVCEACNLRPYDYSFGPYCQSWGIKVSGYNADLEGNKALAWFLRILINHGHARPAKFADMTFPGVCGFTGVCYDEDVVETVWQCLLRGETVATAFDQVAHTFCELWESEDEYNRSEECILQYLDADEEIYTEDGATF